MGMTYEDLEQSLLRTGRALVAAEAREDDFYKAAREAQQRIQRLEPALKEAERFMAYFAGETDGVFVGPGTPQSCLSQIREALSDASAGPSSVPDGYSKLPAGMVCKCFKMWRDTNGDHWCCLPDKASA